MKDKIYSGLFSQIDPSVVSIFRIIFGLFMVYQMYHYYNIEYTYQFMSGPELLFPYEVLEFIKPMSLSVLKGIHLGMTVSAVLIALGLFYRYAMTFFFLGFSYFSLVDKTLYNNHLYLIMLLALVMIFIKADAKYSLINLIKKKRKTVAIPIWNQRILMFVIGLPYFFGGIAKFSPNWLSTSLVSDVIKKSDAGFLQQLFSHEILTALIKYGGLIYDLGIVFLLLYKRTRIFGFVVLLVFNLTNHSVLFNDIGLFPFLMICAAIVYFDSNKIGRFFDQLLTKIGLIKANSTPLNIDNPIVLTSSNKRTAIFLTVFVLFNVLFPLRHFVLTGNPEWTGVAQKFAWRMKLQSKTIVVFDMNLKDAATGQIMNVKPKTFLTKNQEIHIADDPYQFITLAKYISQQAKEKTDLSDPSVIADIKVIFNGKAIQPIFNDNLDLSKLSNAKLSNQDWLKPLR